MSREDEMEQRVMEHVNDEMAIARHGANTRTWWQRFIHRCFRKLSKEYRSESRRLEPLWGELYSIEEGLPDVLRTALSNTECNVADVRWFQVMEKPRLLDLMRNAAMLRKAFKLSNFTAADRRTLFWSHDQVTIARSFGYMLDDIMTAGRGGGIPLRARGFPFDVFALAELRDIAVFIDMIAAAESK